MIYLQSNRIKNNYFYSDMNKTIRRTLISVFTMVTIASLFLLVQFGSGGGPCNAGLDLIFLGPIIIISAIAQIVIFTFSTGIDTTWTRFRRFTSISLSFLWIYLTIIFSDGEPNAYYYLLPMLVLNVVISILIFIKFKPVS